MKQAAIAVMCYVCCISGIASSQSVSEDENAIRGLIKEHWTASQTGDFAGLVGGYRDDSDLRWADGVLLEGLPAIHQRYREVLSYGSQTMAHRHPPESLRIRFLSSDVAFADIDSVPGVIDPKSEPPASGARTPFFVVFTKVDGKWGVAVEREGASIN